MAGRRCPPGCPCKRHRGNGGQKSGRKRTETPGVLAIHDRVRYERGKADGYACVDCGEGALDWSQREGSDPLDVGNFDPRCRKCHLEYDRGGDISSVMKALRRGESKA